MDVGKNVRYSLLQALDNLIEDQFERFKWELSKTVYGGKRNIPAGHLENAAKHKVVDLMCGCYGENSALFLCIDVLEKINVRDVAERLKEATQKGKKHVRSN